MSIVECIAGARIHFGLTSFDQHDELSGARRFGGAGLMVDQPALRFRLRHASTFQIRFRDACDPWLVINPQEITAVARRWTEAVRRHACDQPLFDGKRTGLAAHSSPRDVDAIRERISSDLPSVEIEFDAVPPRHSGFGSGTQLSLALAAALFRLHDLELPGVAQLASLMDRGKRSAIGSYGFSQGGLIVDRGKLPGEPISNSVSHHVVPADWRFVLFRPRADLGLSGDAERTAFGQLPGPSRDVTAELARELEHRMIPALQAAEFDRFAESLGRFGTLSGSCFAPVQSGPFNGPLITRLVELIRKLGYAGVGQSSWGPAVFVATPNLTTATQLVEQVNEQFSPTVPAHWIAKPLTSGAQVFVSSTASKSTDAERNTIFLTSSAAKSSLVPERSNA